MTKEEIKRLFDEFYKGDKSRHEMQSTGLGLAICKRIIEKHNGKIWAESKGKGEGSSISFSLPKKHSYVRLREVNNIIRNKTIIR